MKFFPLLIMLASCFESTRVSLHLDPDHALVDVTAQVVVAVNEELGGRLLFLGARSDAVRVVEGGPECGAFDNKRTITLAPDCERFGPDARAVALVHEAGHALGLKHSDDPDSIMFERYVIGTSVEEAAASLVRELQTQDTNVLLPPNEVPP